MKPHLPSLLLGIGLAAGAFLLMGQRAATPAEPGRYAMRPSVNGDGIYVQDTATGAVKFLASDRPGGIPRGLGIPFDQIR